MNLTWEWEGELGVGYLKRLFLRESKKPKIFISWVIAFIVSAIAITALTESVKTAHEVSSVMNFTEGLQTQTVIEQQILACLDALEGALLWIGEK